MWFKKVVKGMSPWLPVFAVNILFQVQRHAPVDGIIFGVASILIILDWKNLLPIHFGPRPVFRLRWIILAIGSSATVLYLAPRHSVQDMWVLLSVIPVAVMAVYYRDEIGRPTDAVVMGRTKTSYETLGIFVAVVELAAYVISDRVHNSDDFPTISYLISPTLEFGWVRFLFLAIWMAMGVGLMQIMRGRRVIAAIEHDAAVRAAARDALVAFESKSRFEDEARP
jgi:hypothetical protein